MYGTNNILFRLATSHLQAKRNVRPQRRQRTGQNPIKSLQERTDLVDESDIAAKDAVS